VGSGLSIAAGVPTGWEVALDIARKVAATRGDNPEPDPAIWFEGTFGVSLGYTSFLDAVTTTAPERMKLLQGYFEPTDDEAADGIRMRRKAKVKGRSFSLSLRVRADRRPLGDT
jgi:hypothetical protein